MAERADVARERVRVSPSLGTHARPGDADLRGSSMLLPLGTDPILTIAAPTPSHAVPIVQPSPRRELT